MGKEEIEGTLDMLTNWLARTSVKAGVQSTEISSSVKVFGTEVKL
jgi:hypothetical protein